MYYLTEVDGFRKIESNHEIVEGAFLTVYDKIYENENALFKVKKVIQNKLGLTLVKVLDLALVENEEEFQPKQLYRFEKNSFYTDAKVNKNQTIVLNREFFLVQDITKEIDGSKQLVLNKIDFVTTTNIYTIYRTSKDGQTDEYLTINNYKDAIITLARLRERRDGYYYRFI